jgi:hypothetical protein
MAKLYKQTGLNDSQLLSQIDSMVTAKIDKALPEAFNLMQS